MELLELEILKIHYLEVEVEYLDHSQETMHLKSTKKVKRIARKSALSYKAKDNGILILEDF